MYAISFDCLLFWSTVSRIINARVESARFLRFVCVRFRSTVYAFYVMFLLFRSAVSRILDARVEFVRFCDLFLENYRRTHRICVFLRCLCNFAGLSREFSIRASNMSFVRFVCDLSCDVVYAISFECGENLCFDF